MIFDKLYLVKIGPIFDDSQLSCVTFHYKILSVCSLGCKNLLNFIWQPANFHNRHHTNVGCRPDISNSINYLQNIHKKTTQSQVEDF